MSISLAAVDVVRLACEADLDEDDVRAAFGEFTKNDQGILAALGRVRTYDQALSVFRDADPDSQYVGHRLRMVLVDMARTHDEIVDVLERVIGGYHERAFAKLLNANPDQDDLIEVAGMAEDQETASRAIRMLGELHFRRAVR